MSDYDVPTLTRRLTESAESAFNLSIQAATLLIVHTHLNTLTATLAEPLVVNAIRHDGPHSGFNWSALAANFFLRRPAITHHVNHRVEQIVGVALHLADVEGAPGLAACLSGLDADHSVLVLEAIARHQGLHQTYTTQPAPAYTITGRFTDTGDHHAAHRGHH